jgi:hypothetical protein
LAIARNSKKKVRWFCHRGNSVVEELRFRFSLPLLLLNRAAASMLAR